MHGAVEKLDWQEFEARYSDEGLPAYHPALLLKVWLYVAAQPGRATLHVALIHTERPTTSPDKQINHETHQNSPPQRGCHTDSCTPLAALGWKLMRSKAIR